MDSKRLRELKEEQLDTLAELENDSSIPQELIDAIKEANEMATPNPSADITTGQPYRLSDADDFPFGTYIQNQTGRIISRHFRIDDEYQIKQEPMLELLEDMGFTRIFDRSYYGARSLSSAYVYEKRTGDSITLVNVANVINKWIKKAKKSFMDSIGVDIHIYSNDNSNIYDELIQRVIKLGKRRKQESNNIALVIQTNRGYSTTSFELPKQKLDIELNYGKGFKPVHEKIINTLNQKNGKGLVLLHGTPGTGKTHYLKHIASKIKDKRVLFIPPFLADFITSPEMTPFLIDNSNSVLFIEDAERVITDRQTGGANGV